MRRSPLIPIFLEGFLWLFVVASVVWAGEPDFTLHKLGMNSTPSVLIIGGIQGDEPGGFSAASLLITNYHINNGTVWVVPNLNFPSIIQRSRGVYGDMNRKFAALSKNDPEYATVQRIQELILTPGLELVLNLHDGGGFYRPTKESPERNPTRWGQCLIIDMAEMPHPAGELEKRGNDVLSQVNTCLLKPEDRLYLKNTLTHLGNPEMEKALSWYAVRHGIPAFGLEVSKNFPVEVRVYYHLLMIEGLLKQMGIKFERKFSLSPSGIRAALEDDVKVGFLENRVLLPLENARPRIGGSIPLPKGAISHMQTSKPILAVIREKKDLAVHYGNRIVTRFTPDWCETDTELSGMTIVIDGKRRNVHFGEIIDVQKSFTVDPVKNYRVNAIGADFGSDESGKMLTLQDFKKNYSLDRDSRTYRIETYRDKRFAGMILVRFGGYASQNKNVLPAVAKRESALGM